MRDVSLWRALLGVEKTVIERVEFDEDAELLVAWVRAVRRAQGRCGLCQRRSAGYDGGEGRRGWRTLDLGTIRAVLEADAPRVTCRVHGVVVASVPWARHGAGHTYAFDETVAWLATQSSKSMVTALMRIAWRTVGSIITRVWADVDAGGDRLDGLARDRDRRDLVQEGPQVLAGRARSRRTPAGVGRSGTYQCHGAPVLRPARCGPVRPDHPRQRGWRGLHRHHRGPGLPGRGAGSRPVPCREVGHRGPGRGPPRGVERRPETGPDRAETRPRTSPSGCARAAGQWTGFRR